MELEYWAKTDASHNPGIPVGEHGEIVGAVTEYLFDARYTSFKPYKIKFRFNKRTARWMGGSHDVGKIYLGFQIQCLAWKARNGFMDYEIKENSNKEKFLFHKGKSLYSIAPHGLISSYSIYRFLRDSGYNHDTSDYYARMLGSHHGKMLGANGNNDAMADVRKSREHEQDPERELARQRFLASLGKVRLPKFHNAKYIESAKNQFFKKLISLLYYNPYKLMSELVAVGGIVSIADWIGSDETYFSPVSNNNIESRAATVIEELGLGRPSIACNKSFHEVFGFKPNLMQRTAIKSITKPGVYVIEAPMGDGKTEAALYVAYNLIQKGYNNGIYFALPTQTTSNRIYERIKGFVEKISTKKPRLIHMMSWLYEGVYLPQSDNEEFRDWFSSNRRALIDTFGVGTVDQALLGVIAAKHFAVRRAGLMGKVIIIDEVHTYDTYTGTLISFLCKECRNLGCTVIILSATLKKDSRASLLGYNHTADAYPLITGKQNSGRKLSKIFAGPKPKEIKLSRSSVDAAIDRAIDCAMKGARVLWICNSVATSQDHFHRIRERMVESSKIRKVALLHARFIYDDRMEIEKEWMDLYGKTNPYMKGSILVSTQIVEQSVDLDSDIMFTELCPTDMVFQRLGRLFRHPRNNRAMAEPELVFLGDPPSVNLEDMKTAKEIRDYFWRSARVYSPYVLIRTYKVFEGLISITVPDDIRDMIEATYCPPVGNEPKVWTGLRNTLESKKEKLCSKAKYSANIFHETHDDNEETRCNQLLTEDLILVTEKSTDTEYHFLNGDVVCRTTGKFDYEIKKAFARNTVRIPHFYFKDKTIRVTNDFLKLYTNGGSIAVVNKLGFIYSDNLKTKDFTFLYLKDTGIQINDPRGIEYAVDFWQEEHTVENEYSGLEDDEPID